MSQSDDREMARKLLMRIDVGDLDAVEHIAQALANARARECETDRQLVEKIDDLADRLVKAHIRMRELDNALNDIDPVRYPYRWVSEEEARVETISEPRALRSLPPKTKPPRASHPRKLKR